MIVMSQYDEMHPVSENHAFFVKDGVDGIIWYIEFYCGDQAAMELGYHDKARPGLNIMVGESASATLLLPDPAMSQVDAQAKVIATLISEGIVHDAPITQSESRTDFAGHSEADLFIRLTEQAREIQDDPESCLSEPMAFEELMANIGLDFSDEEMEAYKVQQEADEQAAIEKGRKRFAEELKC